MKRKRKVMKSGNSLQLTIPNSIVEVFNLTNEDCVEWDYDKENDCFIIKIIQD